MPEHGRPIRVVACDNSSSLLELLAHWLEDHPDIELAGTASDPPEARALVAELEPDVIVSDTFKPGGDAGLIGAFRAIAPAARIVLHTGYAEFQLPRDVRAAVDAVVTKSFDERELVAVIRRVRGA